VDEVTGSRVATILVALVLAACAPQVAREPGREAVPPPPAAAERDYGRIAGLGDPVYEIEPARSVVAVVVRRDGSLARLGHDHVVASHGVHGYVAPREGRADLYFRLDELVVDEPELRAAAGLDTQPSASDVAGTRDNMLGKVLHADQHPFAVVGLTRLGADEGALRLQASVTLHGVTRLATLQAVVDEGAEELRVTGQTVIVQSDFGIVPFSVLGGAIRVRDALAVRFDVRARRRGA
jgi:hypothetical protein